MLTPRLMSSVVVCLSCVLPLTPQSLLCPPGTDSPSCVPPLTPHVTSPRLGKVCVLSAGPGVFGRAERIKLGIFHHGAGAGPGVFGRAERTKLGIFHHGAGAGPGVFGRASSRGHSAHDREMRSLGLVSTRPGQGLVSSRHEIGRCGIYALCRRSTSLALGACLGPVSSETRDRDKALAEMTRRRCGVLGLPVSRSCIVSAPIVRPLDCI